MGTRRSRDSSTGRASRCQVPTVSRYPEPGRSGDRRRPLVARRSGWCRAIVPRNNPSPGPRLREAVPSANRIEQRLRESRAFAVYLAGRFGSGRDGSRTVEIARVRTFPRVMIACLRDSIRSRPTVPVDGDPDSPTQAGNVRADCQTDAGGSGRSPGFSGLALPCLTRPV